MKISLNWIKDYVALPEDMDLMQLSYDLTMSTVEVEGTEDLAKRFDNMVVGVITEVLPHPNADSLKICKTDIGGEIKVKVTMDGDKIAKIEVLSQNETPAFFEKAYPAVTDAIIAANGTTGVDVVSGATCSSKGLIEAVNNALAQIK